MAIVKLRVFVMVTWVEDLVAVEQGSWSLLWNGQKSVEQDLPVKNRKGSLHFDVGAKRGYWFGKRKDADSWLEPDFDEALSIDFEGRYLWRYQGDWYWSSDEYEPDEFIALLGAREIRKRQTIDRAKTLAAKRTQTPDDNRRESVPKDLRVLVWERDGGTCVECGSAADLQFDHIIPVAMGGATSDQNLQILCGACNRSKGASLG
jgi:hypothetical protein